MILATVGTQLAFPRLILALAELAPRIDEEIIAQTGTDRTDGLADLPPNLSLRKTMAPAEFDAAFQKARVVVGHAGIGTILSARRMGKPLVILPRRHALGEHRNDHQIATARQVEKLPGIHVAWEAGDLAPLLLRGQLELPVPASGQTPGQTALIARLRGFVEEAAPPRTRRPDRHSAQKTRKA